MSNETKYSIQIENITTTGTNESRFHQTRYEVQMTGSAGDIYTLLGIDASVYRILVDLPLGFSDRQHPRANLPFQRENPSNRIYIQVIRRDENYFHGDYDFVKLVLSQPVASITPTEISFRGSNSYHNDISTATFVFKISVENGNEYLFTISAPPKYLEDLFGLTFDESGAVDFRGTKIVTNLDHIYRQHSKDEPLKLSLGTLFDLRKNIRDESNVRNLMIALMSQPGMAGTSTLQQDGIKKVLGKVLGFYERLIAEKEVMYVTIFHSIVSECKRTLNGIKVAKYFNQTFEDVTTYENFKLKLESIQIAYFGANEEARYYSYEFEDIFPLLPGYEALRKEALKSQGGRALGKMIADIDAIHFDEAKYPLIASLIRDSTIPVSTFFRKEGDETYFLYNDNWGLFEEFLTKHREVGIELARLASQRSTYEKSLMSYMYFVLYALPEYLEKYTGKPWKCFPKIVESTNELEPETSPSGQTTKRRSALTPIVDNEKCEVIVPYACLKVYGRSTTYTYSLNYSVIHRGLSIEGSTCTTDVEEKLNGRDDYGLMFYTLTGSETGRGYPTFLIIFERLEKGKTRVHFHRTHPLRSKGGESNPVHNWIRTCYNWMVGNVNLDRVKAQQGDLVFVSVDAIPEGEVTEVNSYDSHMFAKPVRFTPYNRKETQNILGYLELSEPTELNHTEHMIRVIPAGKYELRQCRSWEANPKGIWSLRID